MRGIYGGLQVCMSDRCWYTVSSPLLLGNLPGLVCGLLKILHDQIVLLHMQPGDVKFDDLSCIASMMTWPRVAHSIHSDICNARSATSSIRQLTKR